MAPCYIDFTELRWITAGQDPYFTRRHAPIDWEPYEGVPFILEEHNMQGLAATRLDSDEIIWQIPKTTLACVVQPPGPNRIVAITGYAIVSAADAVGDITTMDDPLADWPEYVSSRQAQPPKQGVTLDLHALMTLATVAQIARDIVEATRADRQVTGMNGSVLSI
jgi:hypothetical protein